MSLRQRTYLVEANPRRDRKIRKKAEHFYRALRGFLKKNPYKLEIDGSGHPYLHAKLFWKDPTGRNLIVLFTSTGKGISGGVGHFKSNVVLVLAVDSLNPKTLYKYLDQDITVHEFIHVVDPGFGKYDTKAPKKIKNIKNINLDTYYNSPGEWNAFWQEGAAKIDRDVKSGEMVVDDTFDWFEGDAMWRFERDFYEHMNKKTRRKFDKRLYQLWKSYRDNLYLRYGGF